MTFEEYLVSKKIDSAAFKQAEESRWKSWLEEFGHLSPASFTAQKLYLINPIRRRFPLKEDTTAKKDDAPPPAAKKPVISRPKIR